GLYHETGDTPVSSTFRASGHSSSSRSSREIRPSFSRRNTSATMEISRIPLDSRALMVMPPKDQIDPSITRLSCLSPRFDSPGAPSLLRRGGHLRLEVLGPGIGYSDLRECVPFCPSTGLWRNQEGTRRGASANEPEVRSGRGARSRPSSRAAPLVRRSL